MLTTFGIENFKAFGQLQRFNLAPITLIFGPNSGGKSSIIQSLLLLKQSIDAPINQGLRDRVLVPKGRYIDLGQSKSIHHKHSFANKISFEVGFDTGTRFSSVFSSNDEISTTIQFEQRQGSIRARLPFITTINYRIQQREIDAKFSLNRGWKASRKVFEEDGDLLDATDPPTSGNFFNFTNFDEIRKFDHLLQRSPLIRAQEQKRSFFPLTESLSEKAINRYQVGFRPTGTGRATYLPTTVRNLDEVRESAYGSGFLEVPTRAFTQIARSFNTLFESISYLGPIRSRPKRLYELSQQFQGSVGLSGEYSVDALTNEPNSDNAHGLPIIEFVNEWLKRFEIPYTVSVEEVGDEVVGDIAMLKLYDKRTNVNVAATDVGFGIGQLLPVIIEGALASALNERSGQRKIICVEQPEIHLHPRLQANVADFLIDTSMKNKCQWIVETHSEALMLRIQRRIREKLISSKDVSVVFVEPTGENGSRIMNLRLDAEGNFIDEWPGGFFETSFAEMFY